MNWIKKKVLKKKLQKHLSLKINLLVDKIVADIKSYAYNLINHSSTNFLLMMDRLTIKYMLGFTFDEYEIKNNSQYRKEHYQSCSKFYDNYHKIKKEFRLNQDLIINTDVIIGYEVTKINNEVFRINNNDINEINDTLVIWKDGTKEMFQKIKPIKEIKTIKLKFDNRFDSYIKRLTNIWNKVEKF